MKAYQKYNNDRGTNPIAIAGKYDVDVPLERWLLSSDIEKAAMRPKPKMVEPMERIKNLMVEESSELGIVDVDLISASRRLVARLLMMLFCPNFSGAIFS